MQPRWVVPDSHNGQFVGRLVVILEWLCFSPDLTGCSAATRIDKTGGGINNTIITQ